MCISTPLQRMYLFFYIVYVLGVDQNILGHGIKLLTFLLYRYSIFTTEDFADSQKKMIET